MVVVVVVAIIISSSSSSSCCISNSSSSSRIVVRSSVVVIIPVVVGGQTLIADAVNVNDRKHWLLTPTSDTGKLASGEQLCLDFTAFTRRMTNPCIRAFFAHDDGLTPIYASGSSSTPGDTASPATQLPTTQSRTCLLYTSDAADER